MPFVASLSVVPRRWRWHRWARQAARNPRSAPGIPARSSQQFASSEALGFLDHVLHDPPDVPRLAEVAAFERAVIRSAILRDARTVRFRGDPVSLLTALAERRAPPAATAGDFVVELENGAVSAIRRL